MEVQADDIGWNNPRDNAEALKQLNNINKSAGDRIPRKLANGVPCSNPATPSMEKQVKRLMTFQSWRFGHIVTPRSLSDAGFYSIQSQDRVKCFNCGGGLQGWNPNEDPWHEHAKWFPRCEYLHLMRGEQFVENITSMNPNLPRPPIHNPVPNVVEDDEVVPEIEAYRVNSLHERVESCMMKEIVGAVLMLGFEEQMIRTLIRNKLSKGEGEYRTARSLVDDLLNPEPLVLSDNNMIMDWKSTSSSWSSSPSSSTSSSSSSSPSSSTSSSPSSSTLPSPTDSTDNIPLPAGLVLMTDLSFSHQDLTRKADDVTHDAKSSDASQSSYSDEEVCKVCLDNRMNTVFTPCNHVCCCTRCAGALRQCPVCRTKIESILKFYRD